MQWGCPAESLRRIRETDIRRETAAGYGRAAGTALHGGITPSQTLCSLALMRVVNWDYRELPERTNESYTSSFIHFESRRVPKQEAFNRACNRAMVPDSVTISN